MTFAPPDLRAVILAAGLGRRLAGGEEASDRSPKCLLPFGGRSLLARQLAMLHRAGIDRIGIVTGWRAEEIEQALDRAALPRRPETRHNPRFAEGSVISLATAAEWMSEGPVLLMDADVLCDDRMLDRLLAGTSDLDILVDYDYTDGPEPVKVCVRGGRPVEFSKTPDLTMAPDAIGESVGYFRLSAAGARHAARLARTFVASGKNQVPYEDVLREMVVESALACGVADVSGLPWIEIDFPEDVARAERDILPRLARPVRHR